MTKLDFNFPVNDSNGHPIGTETAAKLIARMIFEVDEKDYNKILKNKSMRKRLDNCEILELDEADEKHLQQIICNSSLLGGIKEQALEAFVEKPIETKVVN